jgi:hypothetical protein
MKQLRLPATIALMLGALLLLLLHTSGIRLGSKTYFCKLITWPNNPTDWPKHFYHNTIDGPTGSFESYTVFGVRLARWSWQFAIKH